MKQLSWLLLVFFVVACSSTPSRTYHKPVYGDPAPSTIAVTVGNGFIFPGTYHLPKGTRLGLLVDAAKVSPTAKDLRDGVVGKPVPCQVRTAGKKYRATSSLEKMKDSAFRNLELHDGDEVAFIVWNF